MRLTLDDADGIPAIFLTYRLGDSRFGHPFTAFTHLSPSLQALAVPGGGTFSPSTAVVVSLTPAQEAEVQARLGDRLPWLTAPRTQPVYTGIAVDALLLLLTFVVTWLWYGRLLAWRPAPSLALALLRVAVFAIWPTFLGQNALRLIDPRLYDPLAGSLVTFTRPASLATLAFLSLLFVVWRTGGRLVARPAEGDDNHLEETTWR